MGWACASCGGGNPEGTRFCGHCGTRREELGRRVEERVEGAIGAYLDARSEDASAESAAQERRLVTALFADLSGFTALADKVDEELLAQVIDPLISRFAAIVAKYEGYIGKYAGDAVLALFGAPIAHEDDASRALLAALEMRDSLEEMRPSLPEAGSRVNLHVGVNTGHVVARAFGNQIRPDYSVLGDAINVAQRLEASASGGEIYVGEATHRLASAGFEFESLPPLRVKGKSEELRAFRLLAAVDRGVRRGGSSTRSFVGRSDEMAAVEAVLRRLEQGEGGLVAVVGEPGVGKSRLLQEARAGAASTGLWWLQTPCVSYGEALAYWPFTELLRQVIGVGLEDEPEQAVSAIRASLALAGVPEAAPYFARLLGMPGRLTDELADLEPEALRRGLHDAVCKWVAALARMQPVVLVVEDLHWCDSSSLELFAVLAAACEGSQLALWLTSRPEGADRVGRVADRVAEERRAVFELGPLGEATVAEMVEDLVGGVPERRLVGAINRRTGGNPFFVEEMVRSLLSSGDLEQRGVSVRLRRDWDPSTVPATVEGVLASRIDSLPRPVAETLMTAAVIGRRVRVPLLEAVAGDPAHVSDHLDHLVDTGFLDQLPADGDYALVFHHALVQDVAYGRLLKRERQAAHLRTAEVAERLYGSGDDVIDLLARHYYLGDAGPRAVDYLERAGARSKRLFANEQAVEHLGRAVDVARGAAEADRLPALMLDLAEVEEIRGEFDVAEKLFAEVRDSTGEVRAWRGLADVHRKQGDFLGALDLVDEAFADPRLAGVDVTALWLERTYALGTSGRLTEAVEAAEAGLAGASPDSPSTAQLLLLLAYSEGHLGRFDSALEHGDRARDLMVRAGDTRSLARAERMIGGVLFLADRLDEALVIFQRGLALAERIGSEEDAICCLMGLGLTEMKLGNLDAAIRHDRRALDTAQRVGHRATEAPIWANLGEKLLLAGHYEEARLACERGLVLAEELESTMVMADALHTLARIALAEGDHGTAGTLARRASELFSQAGNEAAADEAGKLVTVGVAGPGSAAG